MDILSLLPVLEGWTYTVRTPDSKTIAKASAAIVDSWSGKGWIVSLQATATEKYLHPKIYVDDNQLPDASFYTMNANGETAQTPHRGWMVKYDATADHYTYELCPVGTPLPYHKYVQVTVALDKDTSVATAGVTVEILLIEIEDEKRFYKSLNTFCKNVGLTQ
jgi:hypothetical protein